MKIQALLRLIRWRNLLLIIILQALVYVRISAACSLPGNICMLSAHGFLLILMTTLLATAAGYVINDIRDESIDLVNRPEKVMIGKHFSVSAAWRIYIALVLLGGFTAVMLSYHFGDQVYFWGYVLATGLLYGYSTWWKKSFLLGNLVVSIMSGVAILVCLLPDWNNPALESRTPPLRDILLALMWFAALMTLYREIVKDLEDRQGDQMASAMTLPIRLGERRAKQFALLVGTMVVVSLVIWIPATWADVPLSISAGNAMLVLLTVHNLFTLRTAATPGELHFVSRYIKFIMLFGIIVFLIH